MIVAAYVDKIQLWSPVNPVNRIERLSPQGRESQHSKQENHAFSYVLGTITQNSDSNNSPAAQYMGYFYAESNGFDRKA